MNNKIIPNEPVCDIFFVNETDVQRHELYLAEINDQNNNEIKNDKDNKAEKKEKPWRNILSWVMTVFLAFVIAMLINAYVFRASKVQGPSMQPTFYTDDTVFLSKLPYLFDIPEQNDIVVFDSEAVPNPLDPNDTSYTKRNFFTDIRESLQYNLITQKLFSQGIEDKYWIKRVIGVPGDVIYLNDGYVYVNGVAFKDTHTNQADPPDYSVNRLFLKEGEEYAVIVPEDCVFVMGDNRNHSSDSRDIGFVPINAILGKVIVKTY